ncbi:MAG TPA: NAD-dependent epimerase/dehydratase family protein [Acidimicrobiales bacterium]|nr:NAD-dependent epimerase/dehydratase family protein [Acidimicrobiales bacterium]
MRAMVTGGAGFIGSTLVDRLLAEGHEVDAVDDLSTGSLANLADARSLGGSFRFHHLDICDDAIAGLVTTRQPEVVFHLAAQAYVPFSVKHPVRDAEVNIIGSLKLLEASRQARVRKVVYAASGGSLYGNPDPADLPVAEHAPHSPLSPYGVSKKAVIDYLVAYRELHGLEFTALALANVYGPRQDSAGEGGVMAIFASNLVNGRPCTIEGDGTHTRDFVFVDDIVDAFARASKRGGGLVLNIGTGKEVSVLEIFAEMSRLAGSTAPPKHAAERPGDVARISLDPDRAGIHLGWKPWTSLSEGMARVLDYERGRASA